MFVALVSALPGAGPIGGGLLARRRTVEGQPLEIASVRTKKEKIAVRTAIFS